MTDQELIDLVERMRAAQKKYFTDRTARNLHIAKDLELRVDQAIKARGGGQTPQPEPTQAALDL